jgi:hypothetical protein
MRKSTSAIDSAILIGLDTVACLQCDHPYHLGCLTPPLTEVPEGEWFCPVCTAEIETKHVTKATSGGAGGKKKRKASLDATAREFSPPSTHFELKGHSINPKFYIRYKKEEMNVNRACSRSETLSGLSVTAIGA